MKITLQQIKEGNEEVIIRYRQMTERVEEMIKYLEGQSKKLHGMKAGQQCVINVPDIIYLESVDEATFFYTECAVYQSDFTLALLKHCMWKTVFSGVVNP